jgi:tetratricopeptide (TPR) repeat protein
MRFLRLNGIFFLAAAVVTAGDLTVLTGIRSNTPWSHLLIAGVDAQMRGQNEAAAAAYNSALRLIPANERADRVELAFAENALGVCYYNLGRFKEARMLYERALDLRQDVFGSDDPQVAVVLNNIADVDLIEGQYDHAVRYCRRALAIDENALGANAPLVANDLNSLGVATAKRGKLASALRLLQRAVDIARSTNPPHARLTDYLGNLAGVMSLTGHFEEAEKAQNDVLDMQKAQRGRTHHSVAVTLVRLADCAIRLKRYAAAVLHIQEALAILRPRVGDIHPDTGAAYFQLAIAYEKLKQPDVADEAMQHVLEIDKRIPLEPVLRCAHLREYARILRLKGDDEEAKDVEKAANQVETEDLERLRTRTTVALDELQQ